MFFWRPARERRFGRNINKAADYALGGWTISGVMTYYSGIPFSPTLENYDGKPNTGPNNRPDLGSGDPYSALRKSQPMVRGSWNHVPGSGRGELWELPDQHAHWTSLHPAGPDACEDVQNHRAGIVQAAYQDANAFNHTNLGLPNSDVQASNARQITSLALNNLAPMRRLQFIKHHFVLNNRCGLVDSRYAWGKRSVAVSYVCPAKPAAHSHAAGNARMPSR